MSPLVSGGGLFTRGVKGAALGVVTETPTEIGQQMLERAQAGKDVFSKEALDEYIEVGVAAGLLGGTIRSSGEIVGGKRATNKTQELSQDLTLMEQQSQQRAKNYQELKGMKAQTVIKGQSERLEDKPIQQVEPFTSKLGKELTQSAVDNKIARDTDGDGFTDGEEARASTRPDDADDEIENTIQEGVNEVEENTGTGGTDDN